MCQKKLEYLDFVVQLGRIELTKVLRQKTFFNAISGLGFYLQMILTTKL